MGCTSCGKVWKRGICRAHTLIDGDKKTRLVKFCSLCGVNLCRVCWKSPLRRIRAFGREIFSNP